MKKRLIAVGLLAGILAGKTLWAFQNSDTVNVTVTPSGTQSVVITEAEYDFGTMLLSTQTIDVANLQGSSVSATAVQVTNDGTKTEGWALKLTALDGWTAGADNEDIGHDKFALQALFNTTRPAEAAFGPQDILPSGGAPATQSGAGGAYDGDDSASSVSPASGSNTKNLWFRLRMPTSVTSDGIEKTFVVTISVF